MSKNFDELFRGVNVTDKPVAANVEEVVDGVVVKVAVAACKTVPAGIVVVVTSVELEGIVVPFTLVVLDNAAGTSEATRVSQAGAAPLVPVPVWRKNFFVEVVLGERRVVVSVFD
jgi:hypothetical protein